MIFEIDRESQKRNNLHTYSNYTAKKHRNDKYRLDSTPRVNFSTAIEPRNINRRQFTPKNGKTAKIYTKECECLNNASITNPIVRSRAKLTNPNASRKNISYTISECQKANHGGVSAKKMAKETKKSAWRLTDWPCRRQFSDTTKGSYRVQFTPWAPSFPFVCEADLHTSTSVECDKTENRIRLPKRINLKIYGSHYSASCSSHVLWQQLHAKNLHSLRFGIRFTPLMLPARFHIHHFRRKFFVNVSVTSLVNPQGWSMWQWIGEGTIRENGASTIRVYQTLKRII